MAFYKEDIASIELESGSINRSFLHHTIGSGDQKANRFGVRLFRNGEPVSAESATVTGLFMAPDGTRYVISETSFPGSTGKEGNKAYVQLPPVCYALTGQFTLAIKLTGGGVEGTMRIIDGTVDETGEDGAVVPTSTIPTTAEIIEAYEEAVAVMGGSVRFDATQSLTSTEKTTARGNIDAAGIAQVVRIDDDQSLTSTQKATARENIEAAGIGQIVRVDANQSLTSTQKATARGNIETVGSDDIAPQFSIATGYTVGQYVIYNNVLYRFIVDHPAGTWDSSHVVSANFGNDISALKSALKQQEGSVNDRISIAYMVEDAKLSIWESGDIYNGRDTGNAQRCRTIGLIYAPTRIVLTIPQNLRVSLVDYGTDKTYHSRGDWQYSDDGDFNISLKAGKYWRLVVSFYPTPADITPEDANEITMMTGNNLHLVESKAAAANLYALPTTYSVGDIYNGNESGSDVRVRTDSILNFDREAKIYFDKTVYRARFENYNSSGVWQSSGAWNTSGVMEIEENTYIRIVIALLSGNFITNTDVAGIVTDFKIVFSGELPQYYTAYLIDKNKTINDKGRAVVDPIQFCFFTDTHITANSRYSPAIINNVADNTAVKFAVFGGDVPPANGTESLMDKVSKMWIRMAKSIKIPVLYAHGNHDWQVHDTANDRYIIADHPYINYNSIDLADSDRIKANSAITRYCWRDDPLHKVRYIIVDDFEPFSNTSWGIRPRISQAQLNWIVNDALNVPQGYAVIVFTHAATDENVRSNIPYNVNVLHPVLAAYNAKTTVNVTYTSPDNNETVSVNKDFSDYNGDYIANICGHNHVDENATSDDILCVSTTCDAHYTDAGVARDIGTVSEQAIDVVTIDRQNRKIYMTRIGGGSDRVLTY